MTEIMLVTNWAWSCNEISELTPNLIGENINTSKSQKLVKAKEKF